MYYLRRSGQPELQRPSNRPSSCCMRCDCDSPKTYTSLLSLYAGAVAPRSPHVPLSPKPQPPPQPPESPPPQFNYTLTRPNSLPLCPSPILFHLPPWGECSVGRASLVCFFTFLSSLQRVGTATTNLYYNPCSLLWRCGMGSTSAEPPFSVFSTFLLLFGLDSVSTDAPHILSNLM